MCDFFLTFSADHDFLLTVKHIKLLMDNNESRKTVNLSIENDKASSVNYERLDKQ